MAEHISKEALVSVLSEILSDESSLDALQNSINTLQNSINNKLVVITVHDQATIQKDGTRYVGFNNIPYGYIPIGYYLSLDDSSSAYWFTSGLIKTTGNNYFIRIINKGETAATFNSTFHIACMRIA